MREPTKIIEELFIVRFSGTAVKHLRRLQSIAVYLTVLSLLISTAIIIYYLPRMKDFFKAEDVFSTMQLLEAYSFLLYATFFVLLFPLQTYFFYRFASTLSKTVKDVDDRSADPAVKWLFKFAVVCIITYTVNFLQFAVVLISGFFGD